MFFNKFLEVLLQFIVILIVKNPQSFQSTDLESCNYAKPMSRTAHEAYSINEKCNVSMRLQLDPLPATSQIIVQLFYEYPDLVSPNKSRIRISLMHDDLGLGLTDCSDPQALKRNVTWDRPDAFFHDGTPKQFYASSLDCSSKGNLTAGNYCIRVAVFDESRFPTGACAFYYSKMVTLSTFSVGESQQDIPTDFTPYGAIIGAIVAVVILGIVGFILIDRNRRGHLAGLFSRSSQKLFPTARPKPPVRVFLLYSPDCVHHVKVVEKFAAFLTENNCIVSNDALEKDDMAKNRVGWLNQKLNDDCKILIINSWEACKRQQLWLQNKKYYEDDTFISALSTILHYPFLASNYSKLFVLQPAYMPQDLPNRLQNIVPKRYYDLPGHLKVLLTHLHHDGPTASPTDMEPVRVDVDDPTAAWDHCRSAYADLINAVDVLMGSGGRDAADQAGCRLCTSAAADDGVPSEDASEALC